MKETEMKTFGTDEPCNDLNCFDCGGPDRFTFDDDIVSDLHKDAYGYRPSTGWWVLWKSFTPTQKQSEWDHLVSELEAEQAREKRREEVAFEHWVRRIFDLATQRGISLADAVRWDMDAEDVAGDIGYYCYVVGIGYDREPYIQELLAQ
jgi:hypothetical protein